MTGPPGAGKTTLCSALARLHPRAIHLPVDDIRLWVTQGLADSFEWSEETVRQFALAEESACALARIYCQAGFAVLFDHCRNLHRLQEMADQHLAGMPLRKVALLPSLEANLERNRLRTNKGFDPALLEPFITDMNPGLRINPPPGWFLVDSTTLTPDETALLVSGQSTG